MWVEYPIEANKPYTCVCGSIRFKEIEPIDGKRTFVCTECGIIYHLTSEIEDENKNP